MANFTPLGERVVVKPSEGEETTKGGIYLPDTAKEKPQEGEVVAVGPVGSVKTALGFRWSWLREIALSIPSSPAPNTKTAMMSF